MHCSRLFSALLLCFAFTTVAFGQTATIVRNAHIRMLPDGTSTSLQKMEPPRDLKVLNDKDTLGYYHVLSQEGNRGYVYRTLVRLQKQDPDWYTAVQPLATTAGTIDACSFNVKFLGMSTSRQDKTLTDLLTPYHLVIVQELVAPPYDGRYPDGVAFKGDAEAARFFNLMSEAGFSHYLSPEDTGKNKNRVASSSSEWSVVFYRDEVLRIDSAQCAYIGAPLVKHATFDRVPFRFHFSTTDGTLDFSVINVHLASEAKATAQRKAELQFIDLYAQSLYSTEKDFLIVGDMNIQSQAEYSVVLPPQWKSLNDACVNTNVAGSHTASSGRPYDHVMYVPAHTTADLDTTFDMQVIDIYERYYSTWSRENPEAAASSYWGNTFGATYSDHHPVVFRLVYGVGDDD